MSESSISDDPLVIIVASKVIKGYCIVTVHCLQNAFESTARINLSLLCDANKSKYTVKIANTIML